MVDYKLSEIDVDKNGTPIRVMVVDTSDPENIKRFLDVSIRKWRERVKDNIPCGISPEKAACYVDAYQCMRTSMFGEVLE